MRAEISHEINRHEVVADVAPSPLADTLGALTSCNQITARGAQGNAALLNTAARVALGTGGVEYCVTDTRASPRTLSADPRSIAPVRSCDPDGRGPPP